MEILDKFFIQAQLWYINRDSRAVLLKNTTRKPHAALFDPI
jgi:hypothetical protein